MSVSSEGSAAGVVASVVGSADSVEVGAPTWIETVSAAPLSVTASCWLTSVAVVVAAGAVFVAGAGVGDCWATGAVFELEADAG